jgi:hypothetical protein
MKKTTRPTLARRSQRRPPVKRLPLLDRGKVAWQDRTGTWHGNRLNGDISVHADAPANFHVTAIMQPEHPYLWIGIDPDPQNEDPHTPLVPFATIADKALEDLARAVLRYVPKKGRTR